MEERKLQVKPQAQKLTLENRENLNITGVRDVEGFSETAVSLDTVMGRLVVKGEALRINRLNVDTGEMSILGKVNAFSYEKSAKRPKGSLLENLFK